MLNVYLIFAILFAIKCADGATPTVDGVQTNKNADGRTPNITPAKTSDGNGSAVNHPRDHMKSNSSAKKPSEQKCKPSKGQLANMQLQLISVESGMAIKQKERYDCSRKIANLKRSLANELQKRRGLDQDREKMAQEAIDLKISIQNGILALGQK